jgi:hypothetical protein
LDRHEESLARLRAALPGGAEVIEALVASLEVMGETARAPYQCLLDHAGQFYFEVAPPGAWQRPESQMKWTFCPGPPVQIKVTLSPFYAAATVPPGWNHGYLHRLRQMTGIVAQLFLATPENLAQILVQLQQTSPEKLAFYVSLEDGCDDPDTLTLSRHKGSKNRLIPDPFYFTSQGYAAHLQRVAAGGPWAARRDQAVWRGATTGRLLTKANLFENPRVALAAYCADEPDLFDVKLNVVVQVPEAERADIEAALTARGLLGGFMEMARFADYKFALHIDGNTSAAGFFEKFALGCCVLRVESLYEQWFEPRVQAWTHFVPVARDFSDLTEILTFLMKHPALAERIAQAGYEFAAAAHPLHEAALFMAQLGAPLPPVTAQAVQPPAPDRLVLSAPAPGAKTLEDERVRAGWYAVEIGAEKKRFRWTRMAEVVWTGEWPPGRWQVEIPVLGEGVRAGFLSACHLLAGGTRYRLRVEADRAIADMVFAGMVREIVLQTPPPVLLEGGVDGRALGLAIAIGD